MIRSDGRLPDQLRSIQFDTNFSKYAEGSVGGRLRDDDMYRRRYADPGDYEVAAALRALCRERIAAHGVGWTSIMGHRVS